MVQGKQDLCSWLGQPRRVKRRRSMNMSSKDDSIENSMSRDFGSKECLHHLEVLQTCGMSGFGWTFSSLGLARGQNTHPLMHVLTRDLRTLSGVLRVQGVFIFLLYPVFILSLFSVLAKMFRLVGTFYLEKSSIIVIPLGKLIYIT
jgi:hypothetical protein